MTAWKRIGVGALLLGTVVIGASCEDDAVVSPALAMPDGLQGLAPGIHPVLSIPALDGGGEVREIRVYLYEVDVEGVVAAYQGELAYDTDALEIVDAEFDEGVAGAWHVVEPGRLRFAGASVKGVKGVPAITLKVRSSRRPRAGDFHVALEEVTAAEGFADLTDRVVQLDRPVLTRGDPMRRTR
jgi:hypothetical protein